MVTPVLEQSRAHTHEPAPHGAPMRPVHAPASNAAAVGGLSHTSSTPGPHTICQVPSVVAAHEAGCHTSVMEPINDNSNPHPPKDTPSLQHLSSLAHLTSDGVPVVQVPPAGAVAHKVQLAVWAPLRLLHRLVRAACHFPAQTPASTPEAVSLTAWHAVQCFQGLVHPGAAQPTQR
jgi:hypothetical protein